MGTDHELLADLLEADLDGEELFLVETKRLIALLRQRDELVRTVAEARALTARVACRGACGES